MRSRMQLLAVGLGVAMALGGSAAFAQSQPRLSLADRVAALEARVQQNQSELSVEQTNRLAQLEADVKALRALVEQMQNDQQQARDRDKAQYIDLDSRLSKLEGAATAAPSPMAPARTSSPRAVAPSPPVQAPPPPPTASASSPAPTANPVSEQVAYDAALAAVRADQYADSAQRFNAFVRQFPDSALAPNAYYWLGESYYVTQNYQQALDAFKTVVSRFPDSPKTPGALLKLGYSEDGLKQRDAAQATLRDVIQKYPNSDEARQAESRLRAMSVDAGG